MATGPSGPARRPGSPKPVVPGKPAGPAKGGGADKAPDLAPIPGVTKPTASSPYAGRVIARCRVGERLGRGATSHVFRAFYEPLGKDIALKILGKENAGSEELRARFLSEARAVAKISHENIVKVIDVVEDQGFLCILMELVEGPTLQDRLDDEEIVKPRHAFEIAGQIARALEAAHAEKIVHRDVKPANVMLVGPVGEETIKVVDFGLAVQGDMNRVGTPLFMSPEAAQGKRIDEKSDVYALGVCLYRMLTGVLPFTGSSVKEILAAQVNAEMVPPSKQREPLGKSYDALLAKLLVKSKGYRPTAGEAAELLEDVADDLEEKELGIHRERRRRKRVAKKSKAPGPGFWAAIAVVAVLIVGAIAVFAGGDKAKPTPPPEKPPEVKPLPVVVAEPGEEEFKAVEEWIKENPEDRRGAIVKWMEFLKTFTKGKWSVEASKRKTRAEQLFGGRLDNPPKQPERETPTPRRDDEPPTMKYAKIQTRENAFDFEGAYQVFNTSEMLDPPPGVERKEWDRKEQRLKFLGQNFVKQIEAGFKSTKRKAKAKDLFSDAKDGEFFVGANHEGGVVAAADGSNQRTIKWSGATKDAFFKKGVVVDVALDTGTLEGNLVLAALAVEFGQAEKIVKRYLDPARQLAASDPSADEQVRLMFGESGE